MIWLRSTGSTVISQLFDCFIVLGIAFWMPGKMTSNFYRICIYRLYFVNLIIAVLLTPLIYLGIIYEKYFHRNRIKNGK